MLCESCGKREANFHMTKISGGDREELHLCRECAEKTGQLDFSSDVFSFQQMLSGMLNKSQQGSREVRQLEELKCDNCGLHYREFVESGLFGCSECYSSFADNLDYVVQKVQGNTRHSGKVPRGRFQDHKLEERLTELKRELEQMVNEEKYERAAELRDEIKEIEQRLADKDDE